MFDVISTAKNTKWLAFPTLNTHATRSHALNQEVDFQVTSDQNVFVAFNKSYGIELLHAGIANGERIVKPIQKYPTDGLSCGAVSKVTGNLAIGMTNGFIRFFDIAANDFTSVKFKPDKNNQSVAALDYSCCDGYLAAVYDNADINLYGLRTGVRTDTFRLDGFSTSIKFHPVKKFALAVASYEGAVTLLDIQSKKNIFSDKSAHKAPVRDISLFPASQDTFVSCGFDCRINVYDTRKRSIVNRYTQPSPLSSICVSTCGTYCVVGNLKGEVTSFDFRKMSEVLYTTRAHDSSVVRVAFISSNVSELDLTVDAANATSIETSSPQPNKDGALSFFKFVNQCKYNNLDLDDDGLCQPTDDAKDDSWNDLLRSRQQSNDFSMLDSPSSANLSEMRTKRITCNRFSGSPIVGQLSGSSITTTPKAIGTNKSGRAESTPLSFKETSNDKPIPDVSGERKLDGASILRRRSSFGDEFQSCINPSNMSTPLLRTRSPIRLKHVVHDVIEEEESAAAMVTAEGSQMECKENTQNNFQLPNTQTDAGQESTQSDEFDNIRDVLNTMNIGSVECKEGRISMSTTDFMTMIMGMRKDLELEWEERRIIWQVQMSDTVEKIKKDTAETLHAHFLDYRARQQGRSFADYFKSRIALRKIEESYEKLLKYTPEQVESEFPRLRYMWELYKGQRTKEELRIAASKMNC